MQAFWSAFLALLVAVDIVGGNWRCRRRSASSPIYDVLKAFQLALANRMLVTPMLIRESPSPRATALGNLSDVAAAQVCSGEPRLDVSK